jgi:hypothetical protein
LVLEKCKELDGVRGLEEREGECVGERVRGSEVNRDICVCIGRGVEGVRIVVGYIVPELAGVAKAYAGDRGLMKLWVVRGRSSSSGSTWALESPFVSSSSSAAQLNPRPIEVTPQLFPTLTARL